MRKLSCRAGRLALVVVLDPVLSFAAVVAAKSENRDAMLEIVKAADSCYYAKEGAATEREIDEVIHHLMVDNIPTPTK